MRVIPQLFPFGGGLGRILTILLAVLGLGRFAVGVFAWRTANALERPDYKTLQRLPGGVELRRYSPYLVAETTIEAESMRKGTGKGFTRVAGYIFGRNKPKLKMAMTAPVRTSSSSSGSSEGTKMSMTAPVRTSSFGAADGCTRTRVSFVMEKAYSRRTAPVPLDRSVRLRHVPSHTLAARTFSGPPPSEKRIERERCKLIDALKASGLRAADSETLVYGYHDPFVSAHPSRREREAAHAPHAPTRAPIRAPCATSRGVRCRATSAAARALTDALDARCCADHALVHAAQRGVHPCAGGGGQPLAVRRATRWPRLLSSLLRISSSRLRASRHSAPR